MMELTKILHLEGKGWIVEIAVILIITLVISLITDLFLRSFEKKLSHNETVWDDLLLWSPWIKKDPKIVQGFTGEDGTVGFIASWSGNDEVGAGEQEIVKITPDERIDFELRFIKPMKAKNNSYLITEAISETQTKVKWGMIGRTKFPFNIVCFFMQKKVANEFANGLDNLKTILEK